MRKIWSVGLGLGGYGELETSGPRQSIARGARVRATRTRRRAHTIYEAARALAQEGKGGGNGDVYLSHVLLAAMLSQKATSPILCYRASATARPTGYKKKASVNG